MIGANTCSQSIVPWLVQTENLSIVPWLVQTDNQSILPTSVPCRCKYSRTQTRRCKECHIIETEKDGRMARLLRCWIGWGGQICEIEKELGEMARSRNGPFFCAAFMFCLAKLVVPSFLEPLQIGHVSLLFFSKKRGHQGCDQKPVNKILVYDMFPSFQLVLLHVNSQLITAASSQWHPRGLLQLGGGEIARNRFCDWCSYYWTE